MTEAAVMHAVVEPQESPLTPENWGKLGMWLFLAGDAMSFGCLIVGYGILRHASSSWPVPKDVLGINLTAFMTFLLIVSSVWMVLALAAIQENNKPKFNKFLGLVILGGLMFLGCQAYEWTHFIHEGARPFSNPWGVAQFSASFFVITGFHGLHVLSGVVVLAIVASRAFLDRNSSDGIELAGLYWHFVDVVWVFVFAFFYLL